MEAWTIGISTPVALAIVALLGYLVGNRRRRSDAVRRAGARRELRRAKAVIRELETISQDIRRGLATHHSSITRFKDRINELSRKKDEAAWQELTEEAERMVKPTMRLCTQMANAYDEIRQQANLLMTFTEIRMDPLTGLSNRRALDESLLLFFAMRSRYGNQFSMAIFDIDHFKQFNDTGGHLQGDYMLQQVARLLDESVRETDIAVRYGGEEFIVVMPETDLAGACTFSERVRRDVAEKLSITLSGGVAAALDDDTPRSLISRADAALYSAKAAGRDRVFRHTGQRIEALEDRPKLSLVSSDSRGESQTLLEHKQNGVAEAFG